MATTEEKRQAWLAEAATIVTGTDLASIIQLDDAYKSLADLVLEKKGLLARDAKVPEHMEAGLYMEPAILRWYADKTREPIAFADPYSRIRCPRLPLLGVSLDARRTRGDCRPVDAKNIGFMKPEEWGEPGSGDVPNRFRAQLHAQMLCTETACADLAVLFNGRQHRIYTVEYDAREAEMLLEAASDFHRKYVAGDELPPVDWSEGWTKLFNSKAQRYADYLEPSAEVLADVETLRDVQRQITDLEEVRDLSKNRIRAFIGEHAGLSTPYGKIHYKRSKDGTVFDADAYAVSLERRLLALDPGAAEILESEKQNFTTTKPGNRPLLPKLKEI